MSLTRARVCGVLALVLAFGLAGPAGAVLLDNFDPPIAAVTSVQGNTPPGPVVWAPDAGSTGQFLRLVNDGVNSQSNHYAYDLTDAGAYSTINASVDLRIFGGGNPADGAALMLLPTSTYGPTGIGPGGYFAAEEPNFAGIFAVGIDVYPGANDVSIHHGSEIRNAPVNAGQVDLDANLFHRANLTIQQIGNGSNVRLDLINDINGAASPTVTPINQHVSGLLPYENRLQISARTGGANMNVDVDNVDVAYSNPYVAPPTVSVPSSAMVQDFDSLGTTPFVGTQGNVGPGPLVAGGGPTDNFLRLVNDGVNSQANAVAFDRIADAGAFSTITADFDFRATSVGAAADGFSMILLPTDTYGTSGQGTLSGFAAEEPNVPGALAIGFDLHPAGSVNDVSVHYNGSQVENVTVNPALIDLDIGQFHNAHVAITPLANGSMVKVDLTPDVHGTPGAPVTAFDVFVPTAGYENRVEFAARTGGLNVGIDLDNINVQYSNPVSLPTVSPTGLYQDFDSLGGTDYAITRAGSSPGPTPVAGDTGYALRLIHDNVNSNVNAIGFERAADGGVSDSAIINFDFSANDTSPADGFSMTLLPTNNYGRSGTAPTTGEKPNLANTLAVGFDFYPYWTGTNDVSLHWNGAELATVNVPGLDLNNGDTHRAEVSMVQTTGGSNVSISIIPDVNGTPGAPISVVTDHFLAGVFPYDYRVGFAGRTGGANMSVDLDNIMSSQVAGSAGPTLSQDFEGTGQTTYEGHYFSGGSAPALVEEPGNTFLRILHSENGTANAVSFEQTYAGAAAQVDAQFDVRFSGNLGADGGSFVLLNTGAYPEVTNASDWEEPNLAATFGIGFDIYPGTSEVSLHWNGAQVANINTISAFGADMRGAGWLAADLDITYDAAGAYVTLSETNYGIPIYTNHFIAGMQPYESQVVFGGRTGGLNTTLDVDNFNVQYTAGGDFIWINPLVGNYPDGPNWDAGTSPSGADNAFIPIGQADSTDLRLNGTGVLTIEGTGTLNETNTLYLGSFAGGDGRIVQTGGTTNVNGWLASVGHALGSRGQFDISGGTMNVADYLLVGREGVGHMTIDGPTAQVTTQRLFVAEFNGSGGSTVTINDGRLDVTHADGIRVGTYTNATMTQNGGVVDVDRRLHLGHGAGGTGTYNMNDGQLNVREHLVIGVWGTGTFNQAGGVVTQTGGGVYVADQSTGVGTYNMSDGTLNANYIRVAQWGGSQGTFTQTGGTVNDAGDLFLADGNGAVGTYNISGDAQLSIGGWHTVIGRQGIGHFTQSDTSVVNARRLFLAEFAGSDGTTYTMNGGTLNVAQGGSEWMDVGRQYDATFTQNAGTVNDGGDLNIGLQNSAVGTYNMHDGSLTVGGSMYLGRNAGTEGHMTQTGGAVTVNGWICALADNATATASYSITGGSLDANTDYLIVGRQGVGHMAIGGTAVVNAPRLFVGDVNANADGSSLTVSGGTLTTRNEFYVGLGGDGSLTQTGGTINANGWLFAVCNNANSVGTYDISDGELNVNGTYFVVGRYGQGHVTQTGGDVSANRMFLAELGAGENAGSSYTISGGSLNVSQDFRVAASHAATFKVITGAPTINVNELYTWSGRSTIAFDVASDGIGAINVANAGNIAGHLEMGIHGGAALTQDPIFLLIQANPLNGADFDTKEESVFLTGKVGNQYGAMLDPAQGKGTLTAALAPGWEVFFPKANQGWVQVDNIDDASPVEILLHLDFIGAATGNDLAALMDYMTEAGLAVTQAEGSDTDVLITFDPHAGTSTSFFEWDFGRFDPNVGVVGVGANIPEPATLTLLGVGLLAALRRRRRS